MSHWNFLHLDPDGEVCFKTATVILFIRERSILKTYQTAYVRSPIFHREYGEWEEMWGVLPALGSVNLDLLWTGITWQ